MLYSIQPSSLEPSIQIVFLKKNVKQMHTSNKVLFCKIATLYKNMLFMPTCDRFIIVILDKLDLDSFLTWKIPIIYMCVYI